MPVLFSTGSVDRLEAALNLMHVPADTAVTERDKHFSWWWSPEGSPR
jgi:hypothetical protein